MIGKTKNRVARMQTDISVKLMERWKKDPAEFMELNRKYSIFECIRVSCEVFQLTEAEDILEETLDFVKEKGCLLG